MNANEDLRYAAMLKKLGSMVGITFFALTGLSMWLMWGDWRRELIFGIGFNFLNVFNLVVLTTGLREKGVWVEYLRNGLNSLIGPYVCYLAGWPAPMWVTPILASMVFDDTSKRVSIISLGVFLCAFGGFAIYDHQPLWMVGPTLTIAVLVAVSTSMRFNTIRQMLEVEARNRHEIEEAHVVLMDAVSTRERVELELRQAQKLEAVGRLSAGVAHEINTPVQFVTHSVEFLDGAMREMMTLIDTYRPMLPPDRRTEQVAAEAAADLDYLKENVPEALQHAAEGLRRVAAIVQSLKQFAHPDTVEMKSVDLNAAISDTLTISRHEYKLFADVETFFDELPRVTCRAGEVNQVILNLVVNAAQAIGEKVQGSERGRITVRTRHDGAMVTVSISDTGGGIPEHVQKHLFEPFFTTKPVGKGTGQGLAISRSVAEKHGGKLTYETLVGAGTTFHLTLPVCPEQNALQHAA